jgi:uncharacterized protein YbjT (DUF2867 family)
MSVMALTGGTGFVGTELIKLATRAGWTVRALARSPQDPQPGVTWVAGALDDAGALAELAAGAQVVVHVAGVVNAPNRAGFAAGNVDGTQTMAAAALGAGVRRFIHVSSLAAREPHLSDYGWSKAEAERVVQESGLDWTMVRPPAIYGPRDTEMLDLFRMAKWGFVMMPPGGRLSVIEVGDLAALLLALAGAEGVGGQVFEADDGVERGWTHTAFGFSIGLALGKQVRTFATPKSMLMLASRIERLFRGKKAKLTADRVSYMCHPNWVIDPTKRPPSQLWVPRVVTRAGLKQTANAYRQAGWL